jgi:type IV secretion system protein VirD4
VKMIFKPAEVGWLLGRADEPRGRGLWVPWDRTTGVIGPQRSGKLLICSLRRFFKRRVRRW